MYRHLFFLTNFFHDDLGNKRNKVVVPESRVFLYLCVNKISYIGEVILIISKRDILPLIITQETMMIPSFILVRRIIMILSEIYRFL